MRQNRLLLMGSSGFKEKTLPEEITSQIDVAIREGMLIIVGEAHGSCRLFQNYLQSKGYRNVIVGHAKTIRYNVGGWPTFQYGDDLKQRERNMIEGSDSAIIIWNDHSSVISENLEYLKKLNKLTFVYEYNSRRKSGKFGLLDHNRIYRA